MKRTLWRLTAASSGVLVALSMNVSAASASNGPGDHRPERFPHGPVQVADQVARTEQHADSSAKSEQNLPVNANVPVQILSLGHNGGDTKQANNSSADSAAVNEAWTGQSIDQHQSAPSKGGWGIRDDWRAPWGQKDQGQKDHDGGKDRDSKGPGPEGHGPQPPVQVADQHSWTDQDADSHAKSEQDLAVNANVPVQILSLGSNGGDTKQANNSSAESAAVNKAWTDQSIDQHQSTPSKGGWAGRDDGKGHDDRGPQGPGGAFQGASQQASTDQNAESSATSEQIAPINVNAPIQILSLGSNGGDTKQANNSSAESVAANKAGTDQSVDQQQSAGPGGGAFQGASQSASTDQNADSYAKSEQVLPVNANVPVQVLSLGHNGGDTEQSNNSSADSTAVNQAGTSQAIGQAQGLLGGLTG